MTHKKREKLNIFSQRLKGSEFTDQEREDFLLEYPNTIKMGMHLNHSGDALHAISRPPFELTRPVRHR